MTKQVSPSEEPHELLPRPRHLPLIGTQRTEVPAGVPARMLNEVLYCERLMYLEWVQGEFADNYYTVDGRSVHERADNAGGRLPEPPRAELDQDAADDSADSSPNPYQARSVWLTSETLGITAKIDIVEGFADGRVMPIEYKRGHAPNLTDGPICPSACNCVLKCCSCASKATDVTQPRSTSPRANSESRSR